MKKNILNLKSITKLLPFLEIAVGLIFLCIEIHDYTILYSTSEADELFGGLVDFYKYKENTYSQIFLWAILTLTGISYWIHKKLYWILTQTIIFLLFFKVELPHIFMYLTPVTTLIIPLIYLALFIWIQVKFFKKNKIKEVVINKRIKIIGIVSGLASCFVYILLYL